MGPQPACRTPARTCPERTRRRPAELVPRQATLALFSGVRQPVYIHHNLCGATPFESEVEPTILEASTVWPQVIETGDEVLLETRMPTAFGAVQLPVIGGTDLSPVRFVGAEYEERDDATGSRFRCGQCAPRVHRPAVLRGWLAGHVP